MTKFLHVLFRTQTEEMQNEPRYEGIFYLQSFLHQPALNSNSVESETAPQGCLQHHTASQTVLQAKVFKTQQRMRNLLHILYIRLLLSSLLRSS